MWVATVATLLTSVAASPRKTLIRVGLVLIGGFGLVVAGVVIWSAYTPMAGGGHPGGLYSTVRPFAPVWVVVGALLLIASAVSVLATSKATHDMRVWAVFFLCLVASGSGVAVSFAVLGATITAYKLWWAGVAVATIMLGVGYAAKNSNPTAAVSFGPMDLVQFFSQGFLWPSAWPAFAERLGVEKLDPPAEGARTFLELLQHSLMI